MWNAWVYLSSAASDSGKNELRDFGEKPSICISMAMQQNLA